ncbi:MAG TPA: isocitrate lyase/phosphoenolpyruvate mutase family protein [Chitinophagaceae bacterium]|jgi:2-methylisocitrate lyase-like PEP mutase family enzyme|nr:isocitrate lyase/phosphoenolpyruvate mutase family protein [Chitinophagaceae bacterium]
MTDYEKFDQLHYQSTPLILANVWNAKSAQIAENTGFKAVATSSGAIAESLGYKDGEQIPFAELLYIVQRIKASISVPLSVDMERGYTNDLKLLNENIQKLIDTGVVGINMEDAQGEDIYLKKLNSIKNYLKKTNQQLFINARTDGFLQKLSSPLEITKKRAKLYKEVGADGLFVTGVQDTEIIKEIVSSTTLPVNVVGLAKTASVSILAGCGVKRVSMAVFLFKATYKKTEMMAREILNKQSLETLF